MQYTVFQVKGYLSICGLIPNATQGVFEQWVGTYNGKEVAIHLCISETHVPQFSIDSIIKELNDTKEKFNQIVSVIK